VPFVVENFTSTLESQPLSQDCLNNCVDMLYLDNTT